MTPEPASASADFTESPKSVLAFPTSSSSSHSNKSSGGRKTPDTTTGRRIHWDRTVHCFKIYRRCDFSDTEKASMWLTGEEMKQIKKSCTPIVKKLHKGIPLDEENEDKRGLEHRTPMGAKIRQKNKFCAIDSVLDEQDRQWEQNRLDPDYLAEVYIQNSAHCSMAAFLVARGDEEFVNEHVRQQPLSMHEICLKTDTLLSLSSEQHTNPVETIQEDEEDEEEQAAQSIAPTKTQMVAAAS